MTTASTRGEGGADARPPFGALLVFCVRRTSTVPRLVVVVAVAVLLFVVPAVRARDGMEGQLDRWAVLQSSGALYWFVLPLLVALVGAVGTAGDARGFLVLVRSRGVSHARWVAATALAHVLVVVPVVVLPLAGSVAALVVSGSPTAGTSRSGRVSPAWGAVPVPAAMLTAALLAGIALTLLALVTALWTRNAFVTASVPAVLLAVAATMAPVNSQFLAPVNNLALQAETSVSPVSLALFWAVVASLSLVGLLVWLKAESR